MSASASTAATVRVHVAPLLTTAAALALPLLLPDHI